MTKQIYDISKNSIWFLIAIQTSVLVFDPTTGIPIKSINGSSQKHQWRFFIIFNSKSYPPNSFFNSLPYNRLLSPSLVTGPLSSS